MVVRSGFSCCNDLPIERKVMPYQISPLKSKDLGSTVKEVRKILIQKDYVNKDSKQRITSAIVEEKKTIWRCAIISRFVFVHILLCLHKTT